MYYMRPMIADEAGAMGREWLESSGEADWRL